MKNIYYMKLTTKEDIVAEVIELKDNFIFIRNPIQLIPKIYPDMTHTVILFPWIMAKDLSEKVPVAVDNIISLMKASESLIEFYSGYLDNNSQNGEDFDENKVVDFYLQSHGFTSNNASNSHMISLGNLMESSNTVH